MPRAPLPATGVTSCGVTSRITSEGVTPPSSLVRTHAPVPNPPSASGFNLVQRVFAGCRQSLLGVGPSRRYLCESFPTCLDPYPGCSCGALTRFFPQDFGLPHVRNGSAQRTLPVQATSYTDAISGLQSFTHVQARRFARHPGRSYHDSPKSIRQLWLLHPSRTRVVAFTCIGYANRPNRAIDGKGLSPYKIRSLVGCIRLLDGEQV